MIMRIFKYSAVIIITITLVVAIWGYQYIMARLAPRPSMKDTPTSIIGFNHIGLSVLDLDRMVDFYQSATNFEVVKRSRVEHNARANVLYGVDSMAYDRVILKGPNMLLELTKYDHQADTVITMMPPYGPGMTHTCYQGPTKGTVYDKFKKAGAQILSRGDGPIGSGSGRVSYAYGYDPEGNMIEMEQMPDLLIKLAIGAKWAEVNPMWMTQVALISPDLSRLRAYYQKILGIEPYRENTYGPNQILDDIADIDSVTINAAWFGMDTQGKKMELMQYTHPVTPERNKVRRLTDLGYSFSFEVEDIQKEYERLLSIGISFVSAPQKMEDFWVVYAQDPDGNVFSLRQIIDASSLLSLRNM